MFRRLHLLAFSFIFSAELFFLVELSISIRLKKKGKKAVKRELERGSYTSSSTKSYQYTSPSVVSGWAMRYFLHFN